MKRLKTVKNFSTCKFNFIVDRKKNKCVLLKVINDENELLFSDSEEELEEDVVDSSPGLPNEEVNF